MQVFSKMLCNHPRYILKLSNLLANPTPTIGADATTFAERLLHPKARVWLDSRQEVSKKNVFLIPLSCSVVAYGSPYMSATLLAYILGVKRGRVVS